jgi:hypothetical protein
MFEILEGDAHHQVPPAVHAHFLCKTLHKKCVVKWGTKKLGATAKGLPRFCVREKNAPAIVGVPQLCNLFLDTEVFCTLFLKRFGASVGKRDIFLFLSILSCAGARSKRAAACAPRSGGRQ